MKIRALTSFCGALSMAKNEVVDCSDKNIVNDLIQAGYVECVEDKKETPKRSVKNNETVRNKAK